MLNGLYSSASALNINLANQDVISHNLAHVNVPGFKKTGQSIHSFERQIDGKISSVLNGARVAGQSIDFSQGLIKQTGLSLNVALNGEGFFVVQGDEGPLYTRNGNFKIDEQGQLTLTGGQVVESNQGPITLPPGVDPRNIRIGVDGSVFAGDQALGKLNIVKFADNRQLTPAGTTLFAAPAEVTAEPVDTQVQQYYLESSNSQAVTELIQMIAGMRHFEAAQRSLRSISEAISQHTTLRDS